MLEGNRRHILYFDLAMVPHPSDAPPLPLADFLPHLSKRSAGGVSRLIIDNDRRVVRLTDIKMLATKKGTPVAAMLFALGDRDKADPGFANFDTGKVRIAKRKKGEAGGLSVHAVCAMKPATTNGHIYRMVYEDVSGFGRTLIQQFLRSEFKTISSENGLIYRRESGAELKTRPLVELSGHASDTIKKSLSKGRLLSIELVTYVEKDLGFDEQKYIKSARQDISFSIGKNLPQGEALSMVEKLKVYAHKNGYKSMRVRWREDDSTLQQSAKVDTARKDAGEALFIKSDEVSVKGSLPEISAKMSDELIGKMKEMVE